MYSGMFPSGYSDVLLGISSDPIHVNVLTDDVFLCDVLTVCSGLRELSSSHKSSGVSSQWEDDRRKLASWNLKRSAFKHPHCAFPDFQWVHWCSLQPRKNMRQSGPWHSLSHMRIAKLWLVVATRIAELFPIAEWMEQKRSRKKMNKFTILSSCNWPDFPGPRKNRVVNPNRFGRSILTLQHHNSTWHGGGSFSPSHKHLPEMSFSVDQCGPNKQHSILTFNSRHMTCREAINAKWKGLRQEFLLVQEPSYRALQRTKTQTMKTDSANQCGQWFSNTKRYSKTTHCNSNELMRLLLSLAPVTLKSGDNSGIVRLWELNASRQKGQNDCPDTFFAQLASASKASKAKT